MHARLIGQPTPLARQLRKAFPLAFISLVLGISLPAAPTYAQNTNTNASAEQNIAPGPLSPALSQFAGGMGITLFSDPNLTEGLSTPGLQGRYSVEDGFARLLAGSGLKAVGVGNKVYRLEKMPQDAALLSAVTVSGQAGQDGTTEGTGSYTQIGPSSTATGLGLSLRETPQSISVVTRQQMDDQNLLSLGETAKYVTGINTSTSDIERTDIHSRGFHVDNYQYDGVPTHHGNDFFGASTFDSTVYDRIEFVRGATGLMTGAGNPGAAINLVRKRAYSKTLTGSASLAVGSWRHKRGSVDLSTPLDSEGNIRARVAATLDHHGTYIERYKTHNRALLATVEADLGPATTLRVGVDYQAKRPRDVDWGGLPMFFSNGSPSEWPRDFNAGADWTYWNTTNTTYYAGLEHQFENRWQLKANVNRLERDFESKLLYLLGQANATTGLGISPFANYARQDFTQNNGSLQVSGPFSLLGQEHEATFGLTSSRSVLNYGNHPNSAQPIGDIFAWDGSYSEPIWGDYRQLGHDVTTQTGLYGALRASLSDSLKLIVGARQTYWKTTSQTAVRKHNELTPYAGLVLDLNENYSIYASYTDIFQPQDYRDVSGAYLDPVTGKSYETGIKGEFLGGKLNASLAIFRIDQDNVAVLDNGRLIAGTTQNAYRPAKGVSSKGFEAEISGELMTGLNLTGGFSRTMARNADGSLLSPSTPQNLFHVFMTYRPSGAWNNLTVGAGVQWQSHIYQTATLASGEARRDESSYALVNLMAAYRFTPNLSAQLNINNLLDKRYVNFAGTYITYGEPRSTMLTMKYQF